MPGVWLKAGHTDVNKEHTGQWEKETCTKKISMAIRGFCESIHLAQAPGAEGMMTEVAKGLGTLSWEKRTYKILEASMVGSAHEEGLVGVQSGEAIMMNRASTAEGHKRLILKAMESLRSYRQVND